MRRTLWGMIATTALVLAAPAHATDAAAQKAELRKMCDEALAALYKAKPDAKAEVHKAAGYGCFSSFGVSFFVGGASGRGLVHDNATKKTTFMNMGQASGGLDFGVKEYREVLVFKDKATLAKFIEKGWEFGGQGTATAAVEGKGAKAEDTLVTSAPIVVYPMTRTGLGIGVSAGARKYWKDKDLD
ncbi:MAG: YSC84-related protein [Burkholderiaceae bacterium]